MSLERARFGWLLRTGALLVAAAAIVVAPLPGATQVAAKGNRPQAHLPNFDIARAERNATLPSPQGLRPAARVLGVAGVKTLPLTDAVVRYEAGVGFPTRVQRPSGVLTMPVGGDAAEIARAFVAKNPGLYGLSTAETKSLVSLRRLETPGTGVTHLTFGQQYRGIPVFKAGLKADVRADGALLSTSGTLIPSLPRAVNAAAPKISVLRAFQLAAGYAGLVGAPLPGPVGQPEGVRLTTPFAAGTLFTQPPVLQLTYFAGSGRAVLAWDTTLYLAATGDAYHLLVDAVTGELLFRLNYLSHASGPVYVTEAPTEEFPFSNPAPLVLARATQTFNGGNDFNGSPLFAAGDPHFDWWAGVAQTSTYTNNVTAGPARTASQALPPPVNAANGDFTFPLNLAQAPSTYTSASTVNLFYWNNRLHDIWYRFGFNEAAGNFQSNNFSKGGVGNDRVRALAQFGGGIGDFQNNADFATPPDGEPGQMRMFEFTLTNPNRDGDLTADVIAHEYGHGVSNRLVGNANGLGGFQPVSMGEGWSDFQALMVLAQPGDDVNGNYPMGGYLVNDYALGIRTEPYSTNVNGPVFTRTYRNISDLAGGFPEVHMAGEIICNALWQTYGSVRTRLGFATARTQMMTLFIDMLKLLPDEPTFLDCRDKLLLADRLRYGGQHSGDIWRAFASRGMGYSASTSGPDDVNPVEAFDVPLTISGTVRNSAGAGVPGVTVTATGPGIVTHTLNVNSNLPIPDANANGVSSQLVTSQATPLRKVVLTVRVQHTWIGDLEFRLAHPDGTVAAFALSGEGNHQLQTFTFEAPNLVGKAGSGTWTLNVRDTAPLDIGTLVSWSLTLGETGTVSQTATTAADGSYALIGLQPGTFTVSAGNAYLPLSAQVTVGPDKVQNFQAPVQAGVSIYNFATTSVTANETSTLVNVTVNRTGDISKATTVGYSSTNGTATLFADFSIVTAGLLNFGVGETSKTFGVQIVNDALLEGNEQALLHIAGPSNNGQIGANGTATLTIVDDPAKPTPDTLRVTGVKATTITLQWQNRAGNATGFQLERVGPTGTAVLNVGSAATTFTDTGLAASKTYKYRVRATAGAVQSNYSAQVSGTTSIGILSVKTSKSKVKRGKKITGTVTLTGVAAPNARAVTLTASPTGFISMPKSVTVKKGKLTVKFDIKAKSKKGSVTITANLDGSTGQASLQVVK